jgi:hypothetical protein
MKLPTGANKWIVSALGMVCLFLVVNLVVQYRGWQSSKSPAQAAPARVLPPRTGKSAPLAADDLAQYDPAIHLAELKALDSRHLHDEDNDPFGTVEPAAPPQAAAAAGGPAANQPPPPPPPPPLKAMGYNELPGGKKEAMLTYNDDLVVVHEGDTVGTKFKVIKIDPTQIVVEDGDTHQTLELPFPQ